MSDKRNPNNDYKLGVLLTICVALLIFVLAGVGLYDCNRDHDEALQRQDLKATCLKGCLAAPDRTALECKTVCFPDRCRR